MARDLKGLESFFNQEEDEEDDDEDMKDLEYRAPGQDRGRASTSKKDPVRKEKESFILASNLASEQEPKDLLILALLTKVLEGRGCRRRRSARKASSLPGGSSSQSSSDDEEDLSGQLTCVPVRVPPTRAPQIKSRPDF